MDILDIKEAELTTLGVDESLIHKEEFQIDSIEKLTWFINKIELLKARIERHRKIADAKRAELDKVVGDALDSIESDFINETAGYRNDINTLGAFLGAKAKAFAVQHLKTSPGKSKSFKIGTAQMGFKKAPDKAVIDNKDEFIDWALQNNRELEFVKFETKVIESKLKEALSDGEVMPGVHLEQGEDEFFMKIGLEKMEIQEDA